jgi:membrane-associated phospholipid phosphatase
MSVPVTLILLGVFAAVNTDQLDLHMSLNRMHPAWADLFFMVITHLADGWMAVAIVLCLAVFVSYRAALFVGLSTAVSGVIVQFLKRVAFSDIKRPAYYLEQMPELRVPEGVDLAYQFSFPSGHATTAFAAYMALFLLYHKRNWALLLVSLAILTAYSRVWISMHFLEDVMAGSLIGAFSAMLFYQWLYSSKMMLRTKLDRRVLSPK